MKIETQSPLAAIKELTAAENRSTDPFRRGQRALIYQVPDTQFFPTVYQFNPEQSLSYNPEQTQVSLLEPTNQIVREVVWPMVDHAFSRYTPDQKGNGIDGARIRLTGDEYDVSGKTKVVVAIQNGTVLGSLRIVQANSHHDIQPPIDAMLLMTGHKWPSPNQTSFGEFSRFTLHPNLHKKAEKRAVQRKLYQEAVEHAQNQGFADNVYVILGNHVLRFVHESGINTEPFPDATPNWGNPEAKKVFIQFPYYWDPGKYYKNAEPPQLHRFLPTLNQI